MSTRKADPGLEAVAIIGMSCRFPGAAGVEEFWSNLREGVESVRFFDRRELEAAGVPRSLLDDPAYVPAQAVLDGIDLFDAGFFGFTPRVAEGTDPQHRLFLECSWEALEKAGYDPAAYRGAIGLFAGSSMNTYLLSSPGYQEQLLSSVGGQQAAIGNRTDHLTTMVAYKLDLRGPAVTVQTTCSTSLVAIHLACQSLLNYQCHMALAGGARVMVPQAAGCLYRPGGINSPDGHCRPFDARAQGTLTGSGVGVVVLKRLADAVKDGDEIHAVIRGTAINNDGGVKAGYTAPSIEGQAKVIATAQAVAGVHPEEIGYIEAHGTGTPLGDPIELAALTRVFRAKTGRQGFCALGAVKSNFGHLDTAAGMAGLIKTALVLKHGQIPPTLHFERPNPELRLEESAFYVPSTLTEWPRENGPRRAGVSSFGIGGTNAHVVLEEAPPAAPSGPSRPVQLLLCSARTPAALEAATRNLRRHLETETSQDLADVAYTLRVGRRPFEVRRAVVCHDRAEAVDLLGSLHPARVHTSLQEPRERSVTFLFPGQGAQHAGMGMELYETEEVFRREVDRCCLLLAPRLGLDLRRELLRPEGESRLDETFLTQPALFVLEYALARLWMSWGITPQAMIGHSLGEYVAACLAGVFSLEDALRLVAERGRLMQELPPGAMLSVQLPEEELRRHLGASLSLAAVNRPSLCVVAGPVEEVESLERTLSAEGVACRRLRTSRAFHSSLVEPVLPRFAEQLAGIELKPPAIPFVSNLTGRWIRPEEATDPGYWVRHLRSTVRFGDGIEGLLRQGEGVLLEVGPGRTLTAIVRQHPTWSVDHLVIASLRHGTQQDSEPAALLTTLGRLWVSGTPVDWKAFHGGERRRRVALPTYPFERRRYWFTAKTGTEGLPVTARGEWKDDPADWFWVPSWRRTVPPALLRPEPPETGLRWLMLTDEGGLGDAVSARLERLGHEVIRVAAGQRFSRHGGGYELAPGRSEDYRALIDDLRRSGRMPHRIVHLWNVEAADDGSPAAVVRALDRSFFSLLFLAQARGAGEGEPPLRIDVVSTGLHEIVGGDLRAPEKAALLGPCKVLPKEYPDLRCRSVDLAGPEEIEPLLAELLAGGSEAMVAHRGGHRWIQSFEPVRLERPAEGAGLRQGGVYLVTGGFGGMGSTLAEHLARTCAAKLILTGRSPLPPREEWDGWLAARGEEDPASRRILQVRALEALGAEVLAAGVDVTDREGMRQILAEGRRRFGPLHGVFHTAAVSPGGLAQLKTADAVQRILAPKLAGTRVLASLLAEEDLDFFLLCSSRSAIVGAAGGIDYTAANAFLDAFAHMARADGLPRAVSINWCGWEEVGMMAEAARGRGARPAAAEGEPIDHPLLARRQAEPGRETYLSEFSARTHWVLNEHRIAGNPVVPGTAYLEMAREAAARHGLEHIEIRDVFFLAPLRLREDESREVRLTLEETDGRLEFQVSSQSRNGSGDRQKHVLGRIEPLVAGPPERRDLAAIRRRCAAREIVLATGDQSEDLGPRWQNVTRVHLGEGEILAALELPEAFAGDLASCALHPALLDRAASIGEGFLGDKGGQHLPFSYQSLRLFAPLPSRLYSHARLTSQEQTRGETISFDVDLLDENGNVLVEIRSYHKKRINDVVERLRLPGAGSSRTSMPADDLGTPEEPAQPAARTGISPAEGIEVFRRVLAHPWTPQIVVSPNNLLEVIAAAEAHRPPRLGREAEEDSPTPAVPRHDRPELSAPYAAPRSEIQARLAEIWGGLLGFRDVGIHDNFFELGGDSVLAIQILARARKAGIEISPNEIFEHQTIAELATHLERQGARPAGEETPPIVPVPRHNPLPLSFAQERLWFLARLEPDSPTYNLPLAIRISGRLDLPSLVASLQAIVQRHEALRTRFAEVAGRPVQIAEPDARPEITLVDLGRLAAERRETELRRLIAERTALPFDLTRAPLLRMTLFVLGGEEHLALATLHHAIADGWSLGLFLHEFEQHYAERTTGRPPRLRALPVQYADYAAWQRSWLSGEVLEKKLAFWWQHLAEVPPVLDLADRPRPARKGFRAGTCTFRIPADLAAELGSVGRQREATLFMTLLAAFEALLSRSSGRESLVVGTPISNRDRPEVEGLIGMFVNTLALRADLAGDPTFLDLLERIGRQMPEVYAHQDLPFEKLVDALDLPRSLSHAPLVQVMLVLRNYAPVEHVALEGLVFEPLLAEAPGTQFDLSLVASGGGEAELSCFLEYDLDLFDPSTIQRLAGHFVELVRGVAVHPGRRLSELPLLTAAESHQLLLEWSDTGVAGLPGESIHQLFEEQVARTPDRVALLQGATRLSYRELSQSANRLAHYLRSLDVGPETVVGVCLERSPWMVVALLGVLKAGAAYLPLDPGYPRERLAFMIADSGAPIVVAERASADRLPAEAPLLLLPESEELLERLPAHDPQNEGGGDALAYVIYTSGSTGRPKGVMVPHSRVINFFAGMDERLGRGADGTWLALTSISFDISVLELLWTLTRGFRVVLGADRAGMHAAAPRSRAAERKIELSLSYFASDDDEQTGDRYRLLLEGARFADQHGFSAVWTPERHFHAFGGIFPNPSVVSAALAAVTSRIGIRAGSVVLPLHNPVRVAEEWSVVDNLSQGRVGISFASGWHPDDFVFAPGSFADRKSVMFEGIEAVRRLWRGEAIPLQGGGGHEIPVKIRPRPVQPELPVWITATGNEETFRAAGEAGAGLLTHLLGQSVEELAGKIEIYRRAWRPSPGGFPEPHLTLMLHTFVDPDLEYVRDKVRAPFTRYLGSALGLIQNLARSLGRDMNAADFTDDDRAALLDHAFRRYFETSSLFGTPEMCLAMIERLKEIGVDEVACLIDFGVDVESVLASLEHLSRVRELSQAAPDRDEGSLAALIERHAVTHFQCTPSFARMASTDPRSLASLRSIGCLMVGGEALPHDLAGLLCDRPSGTVHNMYGPTETTIWSATARVDGAGAVTIGRPIANTRIYVVDRGLREVPQGTAGELCIGGEGVARGYLGRPDVTAERFVPDPFASEPGARLYRTGDLGRHRRDGALEYLSRIDQQVKVRGFRIEPGEIESVLSGHEAVRSAVVLLDQEPEGGTGLVACIAARETAVPSAGELRAFLLEKLPDYMVPSRFAFFAELPLTPNGKVDRQRLARDWRSAAGPTPGGPARASFQTSTEELLAGIFADVLRIDHLGAQDSFFELGGHSLLATEVTARVRGIFGLDLPLRTLFEKPRVASLAAQIDLLLRSAHPETDEIPLQPAPRQDFMPLSPAQQRLWFLDRLFPGTSILNMSTAVRLVGPLDAGVLARSFDEIRRRHEVLRARFTEIDGEPVQSFAPYRPEPLPQVDLSGLPEPERELEVLRLSREETHRPFDLSQGPLLRALLLRLAPRNHLVVCCLHHIAGDGWSRILLAAELGDLYAAFAAGLPSPLPELPLQYADFAHWQRRWLSGDRLERQLAYWRRQLSGAVPTLALPRRQKRPSVPTFRAATRPVLLPGELIAALVELGRREGATLFMVLVAGLKALLYEYTGQEDILLGADIASRGRAETQKLIGFFVNTLLLRTDLSGSPSFRELVRRVREVSLEAFAHQDAPFEKVVEAAQLRAADEYAPAIQVMFVFQNFSLATRPVSDLAMTPVPIPQGMVNFDLTLTMGPDGEGFFAYDADLFEDAVIERLAQDFQALLEEAVAEPRHPLAEIPIGIERQDHQLISAFNEDF